MNEPSKDKVVIRFKNGSLLKGFLNEFTPAAVQIDCEEVSTGEHHAVTVEDLKAIFFVRTFEGDNEYKEKKTYGAGKKSVPKTKMFIKFTDDERVVGYLEGEIPWKKGFFLSRRESEPKGFFLYPVDEGANNIKVYVIASSILDMTVMRV